MKKLTIQIPQDEFQVETQPKSQIIRKLGSTKNLHQLKSANDSMPGNFAMAIQIKLMNVKTLQKQKNFLIQSFHTLKTGAIEALVEKQDAIQCLRQKCLRYQSVGTSEAKRQLQLQLEAHFKHILELQNERDILKHKVEDDERIYSRDISEKTEIIEILCSKLRQVNEKLDQMQRQTLMFEIKYRMAIQKNEAIKRNLHETKVAINSLKQKSITIQQQDCLDTNPINLKPLLSPTSSASTNPTFLNNFCLQDQTKNHPLDQINIIKEQMYEADQQHLQKIMRIKKYYSQQIQNLKYNIQKKRQQLQYTQKTHRIKSEPIYLEEQSEQENKSNDSKHSLEHKIQPFLQDPRIQKSQSIKPCKELSYCSDSNDQKSQEQQLLQNTYKQPIQYHHNLPKMDIINQQIIQKSINQPNQQNRTNSKWKGKVLFCLGLVTGGSLMALINKMVTNNP